MPHDINRARGWIFRYLTKPIKVVEFMAAVDVALQVSGSASSHADRSSAIAKEPRNDQQLRHP